MDKISINGKKWIRLIRRMLTQKVYITTKFIYDHIIIIVMNVFYVLNVCLVVLFVLIMVKNKLKIIDLNSVLMERNVGD